MSDPGRRRYLGAQVRAARHFRDWTQEDLATHTSLSESRIGDIEQRDTDATVAEILEIFRITGYPETLVIDVCPVTQPADVEMLVDDAWLGHLETDAANEVAFQVRGRNTCGAGKTDAKRTTLAELRRWLTLGPAERVSAIRKVRAT